MIQLAGAAKLELRPSGQPTEHLSRDEEQRLFGEYARSRAASIESRLLRSQRGLVWRLARHLRTRSSDLDDLVQEGMLGLLEGIRRFDPARGPRLSTYAAWWIRAYQWRFLIQNFRLVRVGTTRAQRRIFFSLGSTRARLVAQGLEPTIERMAVLLDVDTRALGEMDLRLSSPDQSVDVATFDGAGPARIATLIHEQTPVDELLAVREVEDIVRTEREALRAQLQGRQRAVFEARWYDTDAVTLQALGIRFGVSRERVRQIEAKLLKRLRLQVSARLAEPALCQGGCVTHRSRRAHTTRECAELTAEQSNE